MHQYSGEGAALLAALCWAISALCWTTAGRHVGSLVVNTVRLMIALPLFLLYGHFVLGEIIPFSASPKAWLWLSASGFTGFFLCDLFLFRSLLILGPRLAMLIFSLAPIVAALAGWFWLDEHLSMQDIAGIVIALAGVFWVVLESPRRRTASGAFYSFSWTGVLFAFLATIAQGASSVIAKTGMLEIDSPIAATQIRIITGLLCFLLLMAAMGRNRECLRTFKNWPVLKILIIGSIAGPTVGVALLMYSLKIIPAGLAMTFISLTPILIIPFTVVINKESISPRALIGALVAVTGCALLLL